MAEQRLERDLRAALAADLDPVHGPHPRWADAPVARQIAAGRGAPSRWRTAALLVAAGVGVVAIAVLAVASRDVPVATTPPATIEPWPSVLAPDATPTTGQIALGRVAVATAYGEPALLVRVSPAATRGGDGVGVTIEVRLIGRLDRAFGIDRFIVIRSGRAEAPGVGVSAPDPLAIPAGAPIGTEVSTTVVIAAGESEHVDLGYLGSGSHVTFRYAVHRMPPPPSMPPLEGRCPTLEDYALASLQPSAEPARPSFEPVAPGATPSTGILALGATGILAAPDGSPGALIRVSDARFCERFPDYRPDADLWSGGTILLAEVEVEVLRYGTIASFLPGHDPVRAMYADRTSLADTMMYDRMPGAVLTSALNPGPGWRYRGTMAWTIPTGDGRVTVDVQLAHPSGDGTRVTEFAFLVREGTSSWPWRSPAPSSDPAATPTEGAARLGERVVLAAAGGTTSVVVDGVEQVPRYTGVVPASGDAYLEVRRSFGPGSGTFLVDPAEWVVLGPDGERLKELEYRREGNGYVVPPGWPNVASYPEIVQVPPDFSSQPVFIVAEVPAEGRITLEYRPDGGPALVTWIVRDG